MGGYASTWIGRRLGQLLPPNPRTSRAVTRRDPLQESQILTTLSSRRVRQAPRRAKLLTLTFSLSVALSMAYAPAHAQSETLSINIQAQPLGAALSQLGQAAKLSARP